MTRNPSLTYLPNTLTYQPFVSAAIVLLCARFEEFLRDAISYALDQYSKSSPPIQLTDLPENVQLHIVQQNMSAALQGRRHGVERSTTVRLSESLRMAHHYVAKRIWSDYAIDTGGNPGPDTVSGLLKLVGVNDVWNRINQDFSQNYTAPQIPGLTRRVIGNPQRELRRIVDVRNSVAHSGAHVPVSSAEVRLDVSFVEHLSGAIYDILQAEADAQCNRLGRTPAPWNPKH
ncbi:HEPN domain-containing protein [Planotetraspora mira]|uniref:HEPN domain-containing protein n=1 Tax=Planotetraspora mira TaxID=58121 RepID=UPI003670350A